jgi:hypothetical protein
MQGLQRGDVKLAKELGGCDATIAILFTLNYHRCYPPAQESIAVSGGTSEKMTQQEYFESVLTQQLPNPTKV